jgi:hypothetical protein
MSPLGDAADVNPVIKFLSHMWQHPAVDSSVCLHDPSSQLWQITWHSCDEVSRKHSLLSTARCCNVCGRILITGLTSAASPRVDIPSTCKVGQKLKVSLPLLTRFSSAWPSWLLYRRGRKSRRDLRITLYVCIYISGIKLHVSVNNEASM